MWARLPIALLLSVAALLELAVAAQGLPKLPVLPIGLLARQDQKSRGFIVQNDALGVDLVDSWPARTIKVPISRFANDSRYAPHRNGTFDMRFWVDEQYWDRETGPVFILLGGETSGKGRLPFLESGILPILAKPTNGLSIVLEHRYYGDSRVANSLSTDDLRFLTTEQSLADVAYFIEHLKLGNHTKISSLPVIVYGGSYAGAQAAFLRKLYPDLVFGAIASSAVTTAIYDYYQYFDIIRQYAPRDCVDTIVASIELVDTLLLMNNTQVTRKLKTAFGLPNVTDDRDFVNMLAAPLGYWQMKNWDLKTDFFDEFCTDLRAGEEDDLLDQLAAVHGGILRISAYARYIRTKLAPICDDEDQDACFNTHDAESLARASIKDTWRLWLWQCCTEWAYWMPAAPLGVPSMISRLITTDWIQSVCPLAFPDGKHTSLPKRPETGRINQWGNFSMGTSMARLAFIDGSIDPWRPATPHAEEAPARKDTVSRPFKLIKDGVHHWDENGAKQEPPEIREIHAEEIAFVKSWLRDWEAGVRGP